MRKSVFDKDGQCERRSIAEAQQDRGSERVAEDKHPVITLRVLAGRILDILLLHVKQKRFSHYF